MGPPAPASLAVSWRVFPRSITVMGGQARAFILAVLSGLLLILSYPRFDVSFLAWVGLVPLLLALRAQSLLRSFRLSFLTGICFAMGHFYWITYLVSFQAADFLLLGLYLGTCIGVFGLCVTFLSRRTTTPLIVLVPLLWVAIEYFRSHFTFLGLPWGLLGHTQYRSIPLIQIAAVTGAYGVSFLVVLVNAALAELVSRGRGAWRPALVVSCIVAGSVAYGWLVLSSARETPTIRVAVIQANISQDQKWDREYQRRNLDRHIRLTTEMAGNQSLALVVWPESSVPGSLTDNSRLRRLTTRLSEKINAPLLVGNASRQKFVTKEVREKALLNSGYLVSPRGVEQQYDKIHLVPFGEYLPYRAIIPWPSRYAAAAGRFSPGKEYTVFALKEATFSVLICWETIFPDLVRQFVKRGARFLVNIGNEAWFGRSAAPYQFLSMNVFRAVENRRSLARSINTGISAMIDPFGRILGRVERDGEDIFVAGSLVRDLPLVEEVTFFTRYGDLFAQAVCAITVVLLLIGISRHGALTGVRVRP